MAKKKTTEDPSAPPAPVRRRAPSKKTATASTAAPGNGKPEPSRAEIAEAAYYRHLKRGGGHGDEFSDWIEAERELKQRHSR